MPSAPALPERVDVVIAGAGVAGAATAWWLARAGLRVLVLERERVPAAHSSGRNAAIGRLVCHDPTDRATARASLAFYADPPAGFAPGAIARRTGALTLASGRELERLEQTARALEREGVATRWLTPAEAYARQPVLRGARFERALWCPDEVVLDVHAIVQGFLQGAREAGAVIDTGHGVDELEVARGRVHTVVSAGRRVRTEWLVDAAGGWAGELGDQAGAAAMPLRVTRRHLLVTAPDPAIDPESPIAWDVSAHFYVRPESGGWLLSGCDLTDHPPADVQPDPAVVTRVLEKLLAHLPALADARLARAWAGLRVLTPDGRPIVGPDPQLSGFLWVAGLGGHGMSGGAAIGRIAARWITGPAAGDDPLARAFDPARFVTAGAGRQALFRNETVARDSAGADWRGTRFEDAEGVQKYVEDGFGSRDAASR